MAYHPHGEPIVRIGYPPHSIHIHQPPPHALIWDIQAAITRRLAMWSLFSAVSGLVMLITRVPFLRGLGTQFLGWSAVHITGATIAQRASNIRLAQPDALSDPAMCAECDALERTLWTSAAFDTLYITAGALLAFDSQAPGDEQRGHGAGIMAQGGFLLLFDIAHAIMVRRRNR